jgi:hypothetical protein
MRTTRNPRNRFLSGILLCWCMLLQPLFGQAQAGTNLWQKVDGLVPGSEIVVTLATRHKVAGAFRTSNDTMLILLVNGGEMRIAKSEVQTVAAEIKDRLRNGALTGGAIGFAAGFFSLAAFNAKVTASGPIWEREAVGYYVDAGLIGAGIGLIAGIAADALHRQSELLYSR